MALASFPSFRVLPSLNHNPHQQLNKPLRCQMVTRIANDEIGVGVGVGVEIGVTGVTNKGFLGKQDDEHEDRGGVYLEPMWDDGYGSVTIKDYLDQAKQIIKPDGGPPRWFCPLDCGQPLLHSPLLFFLPGLDGTGLGLLLHHKALGKVFEVRCLHIPVLDRTPFEGLVNFVEESLKREHAFSPGKPIYLVGDSFGGCLALAVAARNPTIDLIVILANPATSFDRSQLQPLFPLLEALPVELHATVPYLLSTVLGNPLKMAMADIDDTLPPRFILEKLSRNLTGLLPRLFGLADIIPKDTLTWKLKLLKSAASYANSRLHAVRAEVLVLASNQDNMLPSGNEAERLKSTLKNSRVRVRRFKENGHTLLLEDGINLLTVIKGTRAYRRASRHDYVSDYLPPSMSEYRIAFNQVAGSLLKAGSSVLFSTLEDGKIIRGLAGVPTEGPVLYVGYPILMGLEIFSLGGEFLREKNILLHGLGHLEPFSDAMERSTSEFNIRDWMKVFGTLPLTESNLHKLLSSKSHVFLYSGKAGARETLHSKSEQYKLFWPDQTEFLRMAARFGATIVPFGAVGGDDLVKLVLDDNDLMKIPVVSGWVTEQGREAINIREGMSGEVADQAMNFPGLLLKLPGRFYYLFGKPISTRGRKEMLEDQESVKELYLQIGSEVEASVAYLVKKREEDPYRNVVDRVVYNALNSPLHQVPAFDP